MSVRPATHAGTWYSSNPTRLSKQIRNYSSKALVEQIEGARVLVAPHAGYTYAGERLAEAFKAWDTRGVKRVFILGPSHHVYFRNYALLSKYEEYATPLGGLPVDLQVCQELERTGLFKYMSKTVDEDEHSFEMHAPFIKWVLNDAGIDSEVAIVPILISDLDAISSEKLASILLPYFRKQENHFVVSSDFCHWGQRFSYTKYTAATHSFDIKERDLVNLRHDRLSSFDVPIWKSIEHLDKVAMEIASKGTYSQWNKYIATTGNTICGQKPIAIILLLLEKYEQRNKEHDNPHFKWIGYSQSSQVEDVSESSVSYASGYAVV